MTRGGGDGGVEGERGRKGSGRVFGGCEGRGGLVKGEEGGEGRESEGGREREGNGERREWIGQ